MEDLKITTIDLFGFVKDHRQTRSEDESVYNLEIKKI